VHDRVEADVGVGADEPAQERNRPRYGREHPLDERIDLNIAFKNNVMLREINQPTPR
jgi:hypothetical protein